MQKLRFVVNIDATDTTIYSKNIFYKDATLLLTKRDKGLEAVAYGKDAILRVGRSDDRMEFINPVSDGAITNCDVASFIIAKYLSKVVSRKNILAPIEIYPLISCSLIPAEREIFEKAFNKAGYRDVTLVESILGLLPFVDNRGSTVINIGGSTTEVGFIDRNGIVSACSINIGEKEMVERIKNRVLEAFNLVISNFMADKIRCNIGSLYDNNTSSMLVSGKDVISGKTRNIEVDADTVKTPIAFCYKKIMEVTESFLTTLPGNLVSTVSDRGIYIAGTGAELQGVDDFFLRYLHIPTTIIDTPETATLRGTYTLLENGRLAEILKVKR